MLPLAISMAGALPSGWTETAPPPFGGSAGSTQRCGSGGVMWGGCVQAVPLTCVCVCPCVRPASRPVRASCSSSRAPPPPQRAAAAAAAWAAGGRKLRARPSRDWAAARPAAAAELGYKWRCSAGLWRSACRSVRPSRNDQRARSRPARPARDTLAISPPPARRPLSPNSQHGLSPVTPPCLVASTVAAASQMAIPLTTSIIIQAHPTTIPLHLVSWPSAALNGLLLLAPGGAAGLPV